MDFTDKDPKKIRVIHKIRVLNRNSAKTTLSIINTRRSM